MTSALWFTLTAVIILLFLSAFFSGSETALTAASRARIHAMAKNGSKRAQLVEVLTQRKDRLIGALLLGNNLVNILASSLATSLLITFFGDTGVVYATLGMTLAVVIFAEVLPKTWAINKPDGFALGVAPIISPVVTIFAPITSIIQILVRTILGFFGISTLTDRSGFTGMEEIRGTVDLLHRDGEVVKHDRDMLGGLLDLSELEVQDVMVHRTQMVSLDVTLPQEELVTAILESPYTRIPLHAGDSDEIVGVIHAKNLLRTLIKSGGDLENIDVRQIATPAWFVPETRSVQSQLNAFLRQKKHIALVVDEYGEVQGIITLEDIIEEIVGDIADEHDEVLAGVTPEPDGSYLIDGKLPVRDINRSLDWSLPDEEATTIAGLIIHEARTIPQQGQQFTFHGFRFKIMRKLKNRITQVRVTRLEPKPEV